MQKSRKTWHRRNLQVPPSSVQIGAKAYQISANDSWPYCRSGEKSATLLIYRSVSRDVNPVARDLPLRKFSNAPPAELDVTFAVTMAKQYHQTCYLQQLVVYYYVFFNSVNLIYFEKLNSDKILISDFSRYVFAKSVCGVDNSSIMAR